MEYGLVELRAPANLAGRPSEPLDIYFLLDASGSMTGLKWTKAVEAVRAAVGMLGRSDRLNLYRFSSQCTRCLAEPGSRDVLRESDRYQALLAEPPSQGTELFRALKHVLEDAESASVQRRHAVVLITDGQIGNEPHLLKWLRDRRLPPIHSFGIDLATNDGFLLPLAELSGGSFHSMRPQDDIADIIVHTSGVFASPKLSKLRISNGWEWATPNVPDLYPGQVRYLGIRRHAGDASPLTIMGRDPSGQELALEIGNRPADSSLPSLWWHQQRLNWMISRTDVAGATACSVAANILCPFTAFVTWDESERVERAGARLIQPSPDVAAGLVGGGIGRHCQMEMAPDFPRLTVAKLTRFGMPGPSPAKSPRVEMFARNWNRLLELSDQLAKLSNRYSRLLPEELEALKPWLISRPQSVRTPRLDWFSKLVEALKNLVDSLAKAGDPNFESAPPELRRELSQLIQELPKQIRVPFDKAFLGTANRDRV